MYCSVQMNRNEGYEKLKLFLAGGVVGLRA